MKGIEIFKHKIYFQDLPPTVILNIFSHLTVPSLQKVCCVCKKFKVFGYQDEVYRYKLERLGILKLLYGEVDLNDDVLVHLKRLRPMVKVPTYTSDELVLPKINYNIPEPNEIELIIPKIDDNELVVVNEVAKSERNSISARALFKKFFIQLLKFYRDFGTSSQGSLVFTQYSDTMDIARILGILLAFDNLNLLNRDCSQIRFALGKAIESFSSKLMSRFELGYDSLNFKEMEITFKASYFIDGAVEIVNLVVSKNPAFYDNQYNPTTLADNLKVNKSKQMDLYLSQTFASFIQKLLEDCFLQARIIYKVFATNIDPLSIIMLKIMEECVAEYFAAVSTAAKIREGTRVYLYVTASAVYCIKQFLHCISNNPFGLKVDCDAIITKSNSLLGPFITTYMEREISYLKEVSQAIIDKWESEKDTNKQDSPILNNEPEIQIQSRNRAMSAMQKIIQAPVALTSSLLGSKSTKYEEPIMAGEAFEIDLESNSSSDGQILVSPRKQTVEALNSLVSIELAISLIHTNKESLSRVTIVSSFVDFSKIRPAVSQVFILLLKVLGQQHIKVAFTTAVERLSHTMPVEYQTGEGMINPEMLQFLDLIHMADLIQQITAVYYNEKIKYWIDENDFLDDVIGEKKTFERLLDDNVAVGMDSCIQSLINQCEFLLLSGQYISDYNPPSGLISMDLKPTKACLHVVECLDVHINVFKKCLEKGTTEIFQTEIATRVFQIIVKNIRRLAVSQEGAMQLIIDMNKYYDWAISLKQSRITKMFACLKEVGGLFLADGTRELQEIVNDPKRFNGCLRVEELYELLQSRADYKEKKKELEAKECCIQ